MNPTWRVIVGDVREKLAELEEASVQCVVTSPPYWGLRDYGTATWEGGAPECDHTLASAHQKQGATSARIGRANVEEQRNENFRTVCGKCGAVRTDNQIGLEQTPEAYVAALVEVFAGVRRVLKDDGTLWLNLGDSYASGETGRRDAERSIRSDRDDSRPMLANFQAPRGDRRIGQETGVKPKNMVGIPWRVAFALQQPQYTGRIKDERDRIWLAAMLDAEGCLFIHKRKAGQHNGQGYYRQHDSYSPGMEIANTSVAIVERIAALVGKGSICSQGPDQTHGRRRQTIYRWNLRTTESRDLVQELYSYLIGKQQQARILYGCPASGERAEAAHAALMALHRTGASDLDFPAPPSCFTPGWYLRSDIIWSKSNPMPESVTDRPTKAHEYIFLLTKRERYFYDAEAIAEPASVAMLQQIEQGYDGLGLKDYEGAGVQNPSTVKARIIANARSKVQLRKGPNEDQNDGGASDIALRGFGRNARTVWTISTQPYPDAHFATFPEAMPERCIKAGTSEVGACPSCHAPWRRIVDRESIALRPHGDSIRGHSPSANRGVGSPQRGSRAVRSETRGWQPSCGCDAGDPVPCTVLDPFCGSGTTGQVAIELGRSFIGVELNPKYADLARSRIGDAAPLFASEDTASGTPEPFGSDIHDQDVEGGMPQLIQRVLPL